MDEAEGGNDSARQQHKKALRDQTKQDSTGLSAKVSSNGVVL